MRKLTGMEFHTLGAACEKALIPKNYESNPKSQVRATVIIIYSYTELVKYCAQYCIYPCVLTNLICVVLLVAVPVDAVQ